MPEHTDPARRDPEDPNPDEPSPPETQAGARRIWDPERSSWVSPDDLPRPSRRRERHRPEGEGSSPRRWAAAAVFVLLIAMAGALAGLAVMRMSPGTRSDSPDAPATTTEESEVERQAPSELAPELAASARPWVVHVAGGGRAQGGSGVMLRTGGVIATVAEVASSGEVDVTLPDTRVVHARVTGTDAATGVAILQAPLEDAVPAVLGSAESLHAGQTVVSVGMPDGVRPVIVTGTIAALSRSVGSGGATRHDLLQVGAPLEASGAGSAVIGSDGAVVGLTSAQSSGPVGYAIPIDVVSAVARQLLNGESVAHPWVGLEVEPLDEQSAVALGASGLVVVAPAQGPAARTGLRLGDVIVAIDGREVAGGLSLLRWIWDKGVGSPVALTVRRGDEEGRVSVAISERPGP